MCLNVFDCVLLKGCWEHASLWPVVSAGLVWAESRGWTLGRWSGSDTCWSLSGFPPLCFGLCFSTYERKRPCRGAPIAALSEVFAGFTWIFSHETQKQRGLARLLEIRLLPLGPDIRA